MNLNNQPTSSTLAALKRAPTPIDLIGSTTPTSLAWLLSQDLSNTRPQLVICPNEKILASFLRDFKAFDPSRDCIPLEAFDENPYSGLYPSRSNQLSRTRWFWKALHSRPGDLFAASIEGLLQKTLPLSFFRDFEISLKAGEEVDLKTLLNQLVTCGYETTPLVEDGGTFSRRGDILDVFSPAHLFPLRIEFFGDQIESLRLFDPETQRSMEGTLPEAVIVPAREILMLDEVLSFGRKQIKNFCDENGISKESRETLLEPLKQKIYPHGIDYWLPLFYPEPGLPLDAFIEPPLTYWLDQHEVLRSADSILEKYRDRHKDLLKGHSASPDPQTLYSSIEVVAEKTRALSISLLKIKIDSASSESREVVYYKSFDTSDFTTVVRAARESKKDFFEPAVSKILQWRSDGLKVFVWAGTQTQAQRVHYLFESHGLKPHLAESDAARWGEWFQTQEQDRQALHILPRALSDGGRFVDDGIVFLREDDLFGSHTHRDQKKKKGTLEERAGAFSFGDLNPGDFIVHTLHGIGVYEGLKKLAVQGIENEFIQLKYKDNDKLYLPVYRISQIQKYSSGGGPPSIDKLGSSSWQKAKIKVKNSLKDLASELLELYAKRASQEGFAFSEPDQDFREFEATFPYDETTDQAKAIDDVLGDMTSGKSMDRLVCGDVGFGKTEVAIRAAYKAVQDKKQVAVLVPTTILAFQHYQNFKKRFANTAVSVGMLSRFSPSGQIKKDLSAAQEGRIDILVGTHRLLSKDVVFKDLGLLVVDEEQKFGVTHKEKIKRLRSQVDVLTLSATPIPRTLNMALMGVRDLSISNTPPEDRLSIRTFVSRFEPESIKKAVTGEIQRGGQVYFIHNRVQSINGFADELKQIIPEARLRIGHGQMPEEELEKTMLDFYNHEFDVLLCTTIIESGLDIPKANTIIIDRADTFGLSQLYQLRGRVGRSKERAYCYLLIPPQGVVDKTAQERLKVIQENTELGSGFHIAHHDLELRGSGNILGEDQSGQIAAVGYELYMELLEQALQSAKGAPPPDEVEPEINLRIQALIPDSYIEDIRIRLSYYKVLSQIEDEKDLDQIELELVDRFGKLPEPVTNLFGVMLIRKYCKDLGVRDISAGPKNVSLIFTSATKAAPDKVIKLATLEAKKYQITPDQKLIIRMNSMSWPGILEELKNLKKNLL